jgi:Protein of unknown function (DUF3551)
LLESLSSAVRILIVCRCHSSPVSTGRDDQDVRLRMQKKGRAIMKQLLTLSAAAIACAAFFVTSGPAAAKNYEYCRIDISSFMKQCGFETLAQCQDMSSGRGGSCVRDPFFDGGANSNANAYAYAPIARKHHQK